MKFKDLDPAVQGAVFDDMIAFGMGAWNDRGERVDISTIRLVTHSAEEIR